MHLFQRFFRPAAMAGAFVIGLSLVVTATPAPTTVVVTPQPRTLNVVSENLFGHFLELATWSGESGGALTLDENGNPRADVVAQLRRVNPPLVRYPGGTFLSLSADYEWQHLIDNAPGRAATDRPASYRDHADQVAPTTMGWDELLALRDTAPFEVIAVVELEDAALKREPLAGAALHNAAALVAYLNGRLDQDLPPELMAYVQARAANGHPEPHGVRYFQLGNEYFVFRDVLARDDDPDNDLDVPWMAECFNAYVDAMKAVDPTIEIIADGFYPQNGPAFFDLPGVRERVDWAAHHRYWPMGSVLRHAPDGSGAATSTDGFSAQQWWHRWTTGLGITDTAGNTRVVDDSMRESLRRGIQIAHTEWNWNGWFNSGDDVAVNVYPAMGIGAAAYLNGLIRDGNAIAFANMSMLIGNGWNIPAMRVPDDGPAHLGPQGQAVGFYRRHARGWRLDHAVENLPTFELARSGEPDQSVTHSLVDIVVTGNAESAAIHLVSRAHAESVPVAVDLSQLGRPVPLHASLHLMTPHRTAANYDDHRDIFVERTQSIAVSAEGVASFDLPAQAIAVLVVGE